MIAYIYNMILSLALDNKKIINKFIIFNDLTVVQSLKYSETDVKNIKD